jgi:hypothetical protein
LLVAFLKLEQASAPARDYCKEAMASGSSS